MDQIDSRSASDTEDQKWTSDSPDDAGSAHPTSDCGIGHRVLASRSVLALAIDEHCVFAGLQGGDIFVSDPVFLFFSSYRMPASCDPFLPSMADHLRPGLSRHMSLCSRSTHTKRVCWVFICPMMVLCYFPVVATPWSM